MKYMNSRWLLTATRTNCYPYNPDPIVGFKASILMTELEHKTYDSLYREWRKLYTKVKPTPSKKPAKPPKDIEALGRMEYQAYQKLLLWSTTMNSRVEYEAKRALQVHLINLNDARNRMGLKPIPEVSITHGIVFSCSAS
jgi:hypothetical protein